MSSFNNTTKPYYKSDSQKVSNKYVLEDYIFNMNMYDKSRSNF